MNQHHNSPAAIRARLAALKARQPEGVPNPPPAGPPQLPLESCVVTTRDPFPPAVARDDQKAAKKAKKEAGPRLTYACGHAEGIAHLEGMDCPACRDQGRRQKALKRREADTRRRAAQEAAGSPVLGRAEWTGRFPDRTVEFGVYDASRQKWTGVLLTAASGAVVGEIVAILRAATDDGRAGGSQRFDGEGGGIERLLRDFAAKYRAATGGEVSA